jgi:hypothetical protein
MYEEMETWEVVNGLLARGLKINVVNGVLKVGPRDLISEETAAVIREHTAGLLAYMAGGAIDDDLQPRLTAMLEQLLPLSWPCAIPSLSAVPSIEQYGPADCPSCGELRDTVAGDTYNCGPCSRAKNLALEIWMQRPAQIARAS